MLSHGYIENDFDVFEWAAPEFLEKAAAEVARGGVARSEHGKLPSGASSRMRWHAARVVEMNLSKVVFAIQ